jgi:hypothetical protein
MVMHAREPLAFPLFSFCLLVALVLPLRRPKASYDISFPILVCCLLLVHCMQDTHRIRPSAIIFFPFSFLETRRKNWRIASNASEIVEI